MAQKNHLLNVKNRDEDAEKSAFERFEQELKQNVFGIMSLALKEEESTLWKAMVFMVVSEVQVLSLVFSRDINFPWKNDDFATYFKVAFHVFLITYWCSLLNWTSYLIIFYVGVGVLFISVLNLIYASYLFSSKQFTIMWPFHALQVNFNLATTVLFYPFVGTLSSRLDLYTSMFKCTESEHFLFDEITCWKQLHILHAVVGIIAFVIFCVIYLVATLCFFESRLSSVDPLARANARNEFWSNFLKAACNLLCALLTGDDYRWVHAIVLGLGGIVLYIKQKEERPYYNEVVNITADVNNGVFIWSSFMLVVMMVAEDTEFNGGIQAFLSGLPLVIIFLITRSDNRKELLLKEIENFDSGDEWYTKVRYYVSFIQVKDMTREVSIELKGFIYSHEEKCTVKSCPLRIYINNINSLMKDNKKKRQSKTAAENFTLLMRYANTLFLQGLAKFPNCASLRISYAFFLKDRMSNRSLAINELLLAEKHQPSFDEQFKIFRYKKLIEDEMADVQADKQEGALDAISMIAYDNYLRKFKEAIERSAHLHMEFWLEVLELEPDLGKLDKTGSKIHVSITQVEDCWAKLQKINSNTPKALKLYAEFLSDILNDNEAGGELLSRAKDTVIARAAVNLNALDAAELMNMDDMCAGLGGGDGTACMIASGDQGKLGEIVQFNMALCRVFGYTKSELTNRKINHLMPEVYAKSHDKILQRALNNNDDVSGMLRNDIFVLGKHKSNYLIPLILQTRMVTSVTQGILFVGTFKHERKGLNACYLLLNEQQDVVGVSSRCIKSLKLTNRLLKNSRVSFPTLAPGLEDRSAFEQYSPANSGAALDYFLPETGKEEEGLESPRRQLGAPEFAQTKGADRKLRVKASKESLRFSCIISEIVLAGELSGYLVRLEPPEEDKDLAYERRLERVSKFPNVQFAFDPVGMRYFQEDNEEDAQKKIAEETSMYVNIMRDKESDVSQDKSDRSPKTTVLLEEDEVTRMENKLMGKKSLGEGIKTMRLVDGEQIVIDAKSRLLERKMEEAQEEEEAKRKQADKEAKEDIFQSSLKSKKAFNAALNEKSMPSSIKRLKLSGYIIILVIIALASTEFGVILAQFNDIKENINMVKYSRERIAVQMKMAFYINKIVLLVRDESVHPNMHIDDDDQRNSNITTAQRYIAESLNRYYEIQNLISLSKLSLSKDNKRLYSDKCVTLYYKGSGTENITKSYTLTEAIQQLASEVFTIHSQALDLYVLGNDDIDFVLHNSFADLHTQMTRSADLFIKELKDRGDKKKISIYILFAFELAACFGSIVFLFPMVSSVSQTRLSVLSLFLDIPQNNVRMLEKKAEKFVSKSNEEVVDDILSNEGDILAGNLTLNANIEVESSRTGRHKRKFKNNNTSNAMFYLQYGFAVLIMAGYFSFNFATAYIFLGRIAKYGRELDATTGIHAETSNSYAVYQELVGHRMLFVMAESEAFQYLARDKIPLMYATASEIQNSHNDNHGSFKEDYKDTFIEIMRDDLCRYKTQFGFTFASCDEFLEGTIVEGLHPVIINYIEKLREKLTAYRVYMPDAGDNDVNKEITEKFLTSKDMRDMELTVFEVIDYSIKYLIDALIESYTSQYDGEITKRIILFVCFLILLVIAFLAIWTPFTNWLNEEIWNTKTMLTLIPYDVCKNIASIKNFLSQQSLFSTKVKT